MTLLAHGKCAVFERDEYLYLVSSVAPFDPSSAEVDELSFADSIRKTAPNEHILWMRGTYVEGGRANDNGQEWQTDDISIKSLTPVFMPVTVMHDPRTAVGLIAGTDLVPGDGTSPTRIDNTLAIWQHRFPEIADEIASNYKQGTMMQSQECRPAYYDCGECGQRFPRLPGKAERRQWCDHLRAGEVSMGVTKSRRIYGNVTFTGTGLIFGSRGARGALDKAHLAVLEDEVASFHDQANRDSTRRLRPKPSTDSGARTVDIEQKEYEALVAAKSKVDDLSARVEGLEAEAAKVPDLTRQVEQLEIDKKKATDDLSAATTKIEAHEAEASQGRLADQRLGGLGKGFKTKLPESVSERLKGQAGTLSDDDWTARIDELSEMLGVKPDDKGESGSGSETQSKDGSGSGTFSEEETSRSQAGQGGTGGGGGEPSRAATQATVAGLLGRLGPQRGAPSTKEPASK